jgi:hypothetical protein
MSATRLFAAALALCFALIAQGVELRTRGETYTLNPFDAPLSGTYNYFGQYAFPIEHTGGTLLHLFPNGLFVVSKWTDIGPNEFLASGRYNVKEARLALSFSKIEMGRERDLTWLSDLHVVWGNIKRENYVTGFEVFVFSGSDWEKLMRGAKEVTFMERKVPYNDWEHILHEFQK